MAIQSIDLYRLAEELATFLDENRWRAAINRAYYASYHHAIEWERGLPAPGSASGRRGGVHQQLINRLMNPAPELSAMQRAKSRVMGGRLDRQRDRRSNVDYWLESPVTKRYVKDQIDDATVVIGIV